VVIVDELNSAFGRCRYASVLRREGGYFVLRNCHLDRIEPFIRGTSKIEFIEDNPTLLRERFMIEAAQRAIE
jgi:hypothetical protein